jgi:N-acetyl-alpha-D-muramate 1-phosphate uridylyltransferase
MQAVILAGGLATRLRARTLTTPKALLEVLGRPFIDWQLELIRSSGFESALLCIGHLGERIKEYVGNGARFALAVSYSDDGPRLLGTAGALRRALDQLEPEFLVTYGDSYLPFDYSSALRDLRSHPDALGTLAVFRNRDRWDKSNVELAGELVLRYEKGGSDPALEYIDYGAIALRREVIQSIPEATSYGLDQVQTELARQRRLRALIAEQRFFEIGSEQGLRDLEQRLRDELG